MKWLRTFAQISCFSLLAITPAFALDYEDYPSIRLRSLDKITARTLTFDAKVGDTIKFGDIYIKIQTCRKPPAYEKNEAAAFLQIWQIDKTNDQSQWIFSGWMFSSSPALSGMDHPVYDVWVIDCFGKEETQTPPPDTENDATEQALPDEGTVPAGEVSEPQIEPEQQDPSEFQKAPEDSEVDMGGSDTTPSQNPYDEPYNPSSNYPIEPAVNPKPADNFNGIY